MKNVTIELFEFNELNEEAKENAIINHKDFELSLYNPNDEFYEDYEDYEDFYNSLDDDYIIENILINEYLFFFDGSLANTVFFTGKHQRAGEHEFELFGKKYLLNK